MKNYRIDIFDQDESTRIAVLENAFNITLVREVSKPCQISFNLPEGDSKLDETFTDSQSVSRPVIDIGNVVKIYDESNNLEAVGIITGPLDKTASPVSVVAVGLSTKLGYYRTPILWNIEDSPANVLRALLKEYNFFRLTSGADFDAGTYDQTQKEQLGGIGAGDQGWMVILAYQSGGVPPHYESGSWASATIDMGTGLTAWRKIKFKAGFDEETTLTFQTRSSPDNIDWTDPWTTAIEIDLWPEDGYEITSPVQRYIQVKINFATTDTEKTPTIQAVEIQGTYGTILTEGTGFSGLPTENISYNPSYEIQLKLLNALLDEQDFEWEETTAGAINVAAQLGSDKSAQYTFHEYQHCKVLEYEEDDNDLANYIIALGTGTGLDQLYQVVQDTTSQNRYGKRVNVYESAVEKTGTTLTTAATAYLNDYKDPKRFIRLRLIDTPDGTWDFKAGDTIRFVSPNRPVDISLRIIREVRKFAENGFEVELTLTNPYPAVKSFISEYLKEQSEFAVSADSAIKNFESGDLWTDWIGATDTTWKQLTIALGFTPTDGNIIPIQVLDETTKSYTQPGAQIDYRIRDLRTGEMEFEYRRTASGTTQIRVQFLWTAWSRRRTFGSLGLGGQIE
jgi:hypothetical protein